MPFFNNSDAGGATFEPPSGCEVVEVCMIKGKVPFG
jgi:hypothetical protein